MTLPPYNPEFSPHSFNQLEIDSHLALLLCLERIPGFMVSPPRQELLATNPYFFGFTLGAISELQDLSKSALADQTLEQKAPARTGAAFVLSKLIGHCHYFKEPRQDPEGGSVRDSEATDRLMTPQPLGVLANTVLAFALNMESQDGFDAACSEPTLSLNLDEILPHADRSPLQKELLHQAELFQEMLRECEVPSGQWFEQGAYFTMNSLTITLQRLAACQQN